MSPLQAAYVGLVPLLDGAAGELISALSNWLCSCPGRAAARLPEAPDLEVWNDARLLQFKLSPRLVLHCMLRPLLVCSEWSLAEAAARRCVCWRHGEASAEGVPRPCDVKTGVRGNGARKLECLSIVAAEPVASEGAPASHSASHSCGHEHAHIILGTRPHLLQACSDPSTSHCTNSVACSRSCLPNCSKMLTQAQQLRTSLPWTTAARPRCSRIQTARLLGVQADTITFIGWPAARWSCLGAQSAA